MKLVLTVAVLAVSMVGCSQKEEKKPEVSNTEAKGQTAKKEAVVIVPDTVKGKWKSVVIAVTDKSTNRETPYTVGIGSSFAIPGSDLSVKVENFLPQFTMEGTTLTSLSNEPKNPAAQVRIMEKGNEIYKGWLFTLYPTTHAFQHPQYSFTLVDFIPAP